MLYNIFWSENAVQTLKEIYIWYKEDYSVSRAQKVIKSIRKSVTEISKNPYHYQQCFRVLNPNTNIRNCLVHNTFWIVFEIENNQIKILDIISGFQNPDLYQNINF
jgi:plasmid stabilization system protein ParE